MFESAELGHSVDDKIFKKRAPVLRADLLDTQYDLIAKKTFPVLLLINGVDGAGKVETVSVLNEWMDTRHILNHAFAEPSKDERAHPHLWRYWQALPPKGKVGILFGNWYTQPILDRAYGKIPNAEIDTEVEKINHFEKMLCDEGTLVLKFWFHLSKKAQKERLDTLYRNKETRWRVTDAEWKHFKLYDKFIKVSERVLRQTSTAAAPWIIVEGRDHNYRTLTVAEEVYKALRGKLDSSNKDGTPLSVPPLLPSIDNVQILKTIDCDKRLSKVRYEKSVPKAFRRLNELSHDKRFQKRAAVIVFEGMDAAGKGGAIRRVTHAIDVRQFRVIQTAAPTDEERAQPYLWRFWRHVPGRGRFTIYDRSWYGRVLVERVEGFCAPDAWMRAYTEINDFELQMHRHGIVVVKFWLAISLEEQLRRFHEREKTRFKRFKITDEDWRNRKKWPAYEEAASEMIERTSTSYAPWTIVESNDKHFARLKVLTTISDALEGGLDRH